MGQDNQVGQGEDSAMKPVDSEFEQVLLADLRVEKRLLRRELLLLLLVFAVLLLRLWLFKH